MSTAILVLLLLSQTSQPPTPGPPKGSDSEQQRGAQETTQAAQPKSVPQPASEPAPKSTKSEAPDHKNDDLKDAPFDLLGWSTFALAVATVLLAVGTLLLAYFSYKQLIVLRGHEKHFADLAAATQDSANAAKTSAETGEYALVHLNTAQLSCTGWSVETIEVNTNPADSGFPITATDLWIHFEIVNAGNTPARLDNLVVCFQMDDSFHRLPQRHDAVLGPKQSIPVETRRIRLVGPWAQRFYDRTLIIHVWGIVHFTDRFGKPRWMTFGRVGRCGYKLPTDFKLIVKSGFNSDSEWNDPAEAGKDDERRYNPQNWD